MSVVRIVILGWGLLVVACSDNVEAPQTEDMPSEVGGDAGTLDADSDPESDLVTTTPAIRVAPQSVTLGVAGATVESANFRVNVAIVAPISTPPSQSETVATQPGIEVRGPQR